MAGTNQNLSFSTLNLMQNCDLPPPNKLFSGHEGMLLSSITKNYGMGMGEVGVKNDDCLGDEKLEILKALRLSQTRAREAERKLRAVSEELSKLIVQDSMTLYAHRLWINLMELQVLIHQKEKSSKMEDCDCDCDCDENKNWCTAIVFCLAITGMTFAFGCTYLF